jgi:hypothetical protein
MSPHRVALCSLFVLAACDLGDVRDLGSPGGPDADVADPQADASPAEVACRDTVPGVGGGEHNAGQACIACHEADGGPRFTLAGTLYDDVAGTAPIAGATIIVTDANGATTDLVTQQNGNFWTNEPLVFPVHVAASACPDTVPMIGAITTGDCSAGGCHAAGSATGRVHLP